MMRSIGMPGPRNLFTDLPPREETGQGEVFQTLLETPTVRIERIVSRAAASPAGFWYDQEWDEWIVVMEGEATLLLAGPEERVELKEGDHLFIPKHRKHRVERTSERTIWLAVHVA